MFQFSTAHWCGRRIGAASGEAGPELWPSRTHAQNGKRLAAYGDLAPRENLSGDIRQQDLASAEARPPTYQQQIRPAYGLPLHAISQCPIRRH
jgi:hypothetical protein